MTAKRANSPADCAIKDAATAGRVHDEPDLASEHPYRLDRRRVLQSTAFRRLEYKTQVFVTHEHDHFRTRLTHTLEVAEISRRLAVSLGVNGIVAETIALAHDLGHSPFGHAGEATLNELMRDRGGFEHNAQSLRVVDYLEHPYPPFRGLNLSFEVREGLAKHHTVFDQPGLDLGGTPGSADLLTGGSYPSIEGQIASLADRLAYDCHDLEDALGAGLIDESDLSALTLWTGPHDRVRGTYPDLPLAALRRPILDGLLDHLLRDALAETRKRLTTIGAADVADVRQADRAVVALSAPVEAELTQLESFLLHRVYRHERLVRMDAQARELVTTVFNAYRTEPQTLPPRFAARIEASGVFRVVCDYVAGMTDRFCQAQAERLG
ncbi:MAG: dNTP triphosphohydrolase [bacterium]|nr:dNTP triphosphohydrolase [bacterium]